jgi:hypothetical protein
LLLMSNTVNHAYRLQTVIKSDHDRYLDDGQVEISIHFESSEPITYRRYKDIWKYIMGFNDKEDYELRLGNRLIKDDEMVIDDSGIRDPIFDMSLHLYVEEDRKVYYYLPKAKTKEEKLKDLHTWFWSYGVNGDTLTFNTSANVHTLMTETIKDESGQEVQVLSAVKVNFKEKFNNPHLKFIMSDNPDLTCEEGMVINERVSDYQIKLSHIQCWQPEDFKKLNNPLMEKKEARHLSFEITDTATWDVGRVVEIKRTPDKKFEKLDCIVTPIE